MQWFPRVTVFDVEHILVLSGAALALWAVSCFC